MPCPRSAPPVDLLRAGIQEAMRCTPRPTRGEADGGWRRGLPRYRRTAPGAAPGSDWRFPRWEEADKDRRAATALLARENRAGAMRLGRRRRASRSGAD